MLGRYSPLVTRWSEILGRQKREGPAALGAARHDTDLATAPDEDSVWVRSKLVDRRVVGDHGTADTSFFVDDLDEASLRTIRPNTVLAVPCLRHRLETPDRLYLH